MIAPTGRRRRGSRVVRGAAVVWLLAALGATAADLPPETVKALGEAKYVYLQSERKSGHLGTPAEIWFFYDVGAVCVGTRPTSHRVRRIRAGRTRARIAVGRPDGPAFDARGSIVKDPARQQRLLDAYAHKYPDRWPQFASEFRAGFASGERVLVCYVPAARSR